MGNGDGLSNAITPDTHWMSHKKARTQAEARRVLNHVDWETTGSEV
jgi:hypothetical protein